MSSTMALSAWRRPKRLSYTFDVPFTTQACPMTALAAKRYLDAHQCHRNSGTRTERFRGGSACCRGRCPGAGREKHGGRGDDNQAERLDSRGLRISVTN